MFLGRVQTFIATHLGYIVLPILTLFGLYKYGNGSLIDIIMYTFFVGNFIFFLFKTAYWENINYYFRYVFVFLFVVITVRNLTFINKGVESVSNFKVFIYALVLILSLMLTYLNVASIRGSRKPTDCINLAFPFKDGRYIITDGGDGSISPLINYHTKAQIHKGAKTNTSMRYATDIGKIDKFGYTVTSVLTKENKDYKIFHEKIYCPCDAVVIKVIDGIEDNIPFSKVYPYNVGNCVVLKTNNYYIVMGHLARGSIKVKVRDEVKVGQLLALTGNCGLTPRPHLHMQVSECEDGEYWQGKGIPIYFNNLCYPVKNKIIKV